MWSTLMSPLRVLLLALALIAVEVAVLALILMR
jgi:hypothetical protein